jgi:hypothetical protein
MVGRGRELICESRQWGYWVGCQRSREGDEEAQWAASVVVVGSWKEIGMAERGTVGLWSAQRGRSGEAEERESVD